MEVDRRLLLPIDARGHPINRFDRENSYDKKNNCLCCCCYCNGFAIKQAQTSEISPSSNTKPVNRIMNKRSPSPKFERSPMIKYLAAQIILLLLMAVTRSRAQCPWTKDSIELHSDCICDFNPSMNLPENSSDEQASSGQPINRMSVQCSPVDFKQLLDALKQTASIELPSVLLDQAQLNSEAGSRTNISLAGNELASQAKLDLLHVSNSSIIQLKDDTFIIKLSSLNTTSAGDQMLDPSERLLVVAIQSLNLNRCGIREIESGAFNGLRWSLTSLSLNDNELEFLPSRAISKLINLKVLDLSNNKLTQIQANAFGNLPKLNTLRLADNKIGQQQMECQQIEANPSNSSTMSCLDPMAFGGLENNLADLNLKNTHLNAFPAAVSKLQRLLFLNLAQNQISNIPKLSFVSLNSLTAINLERNRLSRIDGDTFQGVESSLSSLSLLGNLIDQFPVQQMSKLETIRRFDLGFNQIESLPKNSFLNNKRLILIALDGNPLESLPEQAFEALKGTLRGMSIGGRSLNCDCRLSWILKWQIEFNMQISSRERQPQFCSKPHYLRSLVSFAALKPEHLTCHSDTGTLHKSAIANSLQPFNIIKNSNSTSTPWTLSNQPAQPYFTLPVQFTNPTVSPMITTLATENAVTTLPPDDAAALTTDLIEAGTSEDITEGDELYTTTSNELLLVTTTSSSNFGEPATMNESSLNETASNNLQPRTEDESFLANNQKHKLNRQGFLPTQSKRIQALNKQETLHIDDDINRTRTSLAPNNSTGNVSSPFKPVIIRSLIPSSNKTAAATLNDTLHQNNNRLLRPIFGVFGNRQHASSSQKRIAHQQQQTTRNSTSQPNQIIPALPTTVNVYKTLNHSSSLPTQREISKGARFVDDALSTTKPAGELQLNRTATNQRAGLTPKSQTATATTAFSQLIESNVDRQPIATSNILTRIAPITTTPSATANSILPTTKLKKYPSLATDHQHIDIIRFNPEFLTPVAISSNTAPPPPVTTTATIMMVPNDGYMINLNRNLNSSNNTRMSVSSMYKLKHPATTTTPPPQTTTTITPAPSSSTSVSTSVSSTASRAFSLANNELVAVAEQETQKMMRNQPANQRSTLADARRLSAVNSGSLNELQTTTTQTSSANKPRKNQPEMSETTTRMSATVRFVDSIGIPIRSSTSVSYSNSSSVTTIPTSTTTTQRPALAQEQPNLVKIASITLLAPDQSTEAASTTRPQKEITKMMEQVSPQATNTEPIAVNKIHLIRKEPSVTVNPARNVVVVGEQQHEAKLILNSLNGNQRIGSKILVGHGPALISTTTTTSKPDQSSQASSQPDSGHSIPRTPPIGDDENLQQHRQPRDESSLFGQTPGNSSSSSPTSLGKLFNLKLFRSDDIDQFALIMASLLCLLILTMALVIVCICSSSLVKRNKQPGAKRASSSYASSSPSSSAKESKVARNDGSLLRDLFCCCIGSGRSSSNKITPIRSLMLQDDDNLSSSNNQIMSSNVTCSGSSSNEGESNHMKTNGKAMLLPASGNNLYGAGHKFITIQDDSDLLLRSVRRNNQTIQKKKATSRRRKSYNFDQGLGPLNHEVSIQRHKQALAMDQQQAEYFVGSRSGVPGMAMGGRILGRRKSMSGGLLVNFRDSGCEWTSAEHHRSETLSSCDSDKSCSPGANRNNNYNINEAHRTYLTSKNAGPIKASMFVTTDQPPLTRSGLLKTADNLDYFDRCSRMSSDKSTTDDSSRPLNAVSKSSKSIYSRSNFHQFGQQAAKTTKSFGIIPRATGNRSNVSKQHPNQQQATSNYQDAQNYLNANDSVICDYNQAPNSKLMPISAEEQWPEPYIEPLEMPMSNHVEQQSMSSFTPKHNNSGQMRHNHHQHLPSRSQEFGRPATTARSQATRTKRNYRLAYDDAYLANWHTVSRSGGSQQPATMRPDVVDEFVHDEDHLNQQQQANLVRYRSIPSLNNFQTNHSNPSLLAGQVGGATNWLRWTPPMVVGAANEDSATIKRNVQGVSSQAGGWHQENRLESVYIANEQQQ